MSLELQQKADWAESMALTMYDLKTRRLGAPSDGGAAQPDLTNTGRSTARHRDQKGTFDSSPAASSSLADWIVPVLVGAFIGLALYLTLKGVNY